MVDNPPDIVTTIFTNPDDSEPLYCPDSSKTTSTT